MLPYRNQNLRLLVRYLADECSEREQQAVRAAIAVDDAQGQLYDELNSIWQAAGESNEDSDLDAAWSTLDERIRQDAKVKVLRMQNRPFVPAGRKQPSHPAVPHFFRVAAVVATAMILTLVAVHLTKLHRPVSTVRGAAPAPKVFATQNGQRATITLTDGTEVQLGAASRLVVPSDFAADARRVQLEGEAYFDVAEDALHPFVVTAGTSVVEVLGTEFDVRAYADEPQVYVAVAEGKVALRPDQGAAADTVVLTPRSLGIVSGGRLDTVQRQVDLDRYLAWTKGRLVFEDASLAQVMTQLERWYDLDIELVGSSDGHNGLTACFKDEPLSEILNSVAAALKIRYERDGRNITFFAAGV